MCSAPTFWNVQTSTTTGKLLDDKIWVGVEWDDPLRGKHDGQYEGRRIFNCLNTASNTAASFLPASRKPDVTLSFVEALHQKYATEEVEHRDVLSKTLYTEIEISGKVVHEVGFDKIRTQIGQLDKLKHVVLDAMRISSASSESDDDIGDLCPMIQTLVMRRNLFESQIGIVRICRSLRHLKSLDISGNRFVQQQWDDSDCHGNDAMRQAFSNVRELHLDETKLSWTDLCLHTSFYPILDTLSASGNGYSSTNIHLDSSQELTKRKWKTLKLENNSLTSLDALATLANLPVLESLHLKGNQISQLPSTNTPMFQISANFLDLSYNAIDSWQFIDNLPLILPNLTSLRLDHNPFYVSNPEDAYLLIIARIPQLTTLNYRSISAVERTDAEMFYLSSIVKQLALIQHGDKSSVLSQHPRYHALCAKYGETAPTVMQEVVNPNYLEARLIHFTFHIKNLSKTGTVPEKSQIKRIPKSLNVYQLKGVIRRLFAIERNLEFKLILEATDVQGHASGSNDARQNTKNEQDFNDDDDISNESDSESQDKDVELVESTRSIDNLIGLSVAVVRVEIQ